jgi:protein TonB
MMGNEVMTPPETGNSTGAGKKNTGAGKKPEDITPSSGVHDISQGLQFMSEESTFGSLYENLRDLFFPKKLPPLDLTSQPVPVVDRMAVKRDPVSSAISTGIHLLLVGIIVLFTLHQFGLIATAPKPVEVVDLTPPPVIQSMGGGGAHDKAPPAKGSPPPPSKMPITPPTQIIKNPDPKLPVPVTMDIKMADTHLPLIGLTTGSVGPPSNGPGSGGGIGAGNGQGIGNCVSGDNCYGIDGVDHAPVPIYQPQPEFSEEARKMKEQGMVGACMWVTASGTTTNIKIVQPLGYGLDEEAQKSLAQWKFRPATKNGRPVTVSDVCVFVNFRMY